ncbi:MAG: glucose 1-dehydrogenase [Planctomycetia bacterium]|nr:glucose 1-dehydrogenase [Planctomycetia bacterium]
MNDALFDVSGQVVLVSGGTRGIGRSIAEGFCARGATVVVTGRDGTVAEQAAVEIAASESVAQNAGRCFGIGCDVADAAQMQPLVDRILAEHGRIDTLVNVAGVNRRKRSETVTEEDFDFIMGTNFRGAFFLSQVVGRHMLERRRGSQINIVSLNNHGPLPWVLPYAASKAALGHMTRVLAMEWGPRGIRVNAIAPGFILTDLSKKLWSNPMMQEWNTENTPLRRLGKPDDMIGTAIFLASEASAFMTGQIVFVDGGFSSGIMWPIEKAL